MSPIKGPAPPSKLSLPAPIIHVKSREFGGIFLSTWADQSVMGRRAGPHCQPPVKPARLAKHEKSKVKQQANRARAMHGNSHVSGASTVREHARRTTHLRLRDLELRDLQFVVEFPASTLIPPPSATTTRSNVQCKKPLDLMNYFDHMPRGQPRIDVQVKQQYLQVLCNLYANSKEGLQTYSQRRSRLPRGRAHPISQLRIGKIKKGLDTSAGRRPQAVCERRHAGGQTPAGSAASPASKRTRSGCAWILKESQVTSSPSVPFTRTFRNACCLSRLADALCATHCRPPKLRVAHDALNRLLDPIRKAFAEDEEAQRIEKPAYPDPTAKDKKQKKTRSAAQSDHTPPPGKAKMLTWQSTEPLPSL
ncbi:hypothetical protein B0H12DRAFT_1073017 [Mycena haematopus]|nr:hypothetical protein B0H12DRAFT_1073017 [Mycena haematopus]